MTADYCCGSSPHAWGRLGANGERGRAIRFIPTCVGKTTSRSVSARGRSVHPHVRGEYAGPQDRGQSRRGSSPRAWGIPGDIVHAGLDSRFIPTCVGNTSKKLRADFPPTVHPHVRGEYHYGRREGRGWRGSSPRAWGILSSPLLFGDMQRFIPTCVGNTFSINTLTIFTPVHPHVRGEYAPALSATGNQIGSSPRAWGIRKSPQGSCSQ